MVTIQGNRFMSDFEAKKTMIEIGRRMDQKGYSIAGDGSLSVRTCLLYTSPSPRD